MKFWIDAQLPPRPAEWMRAENGLDASTLHDTGLRHGPDRAIFAALRVAGSVIVTKDEDFVDMVVRLGAPPQVLWRTMGNVTNRALRLNLHARLPEAVRLLAQGEPIVELR